MISRIMVVDDDSNFRKSIVRSLEMNEFEVVEANNGKEALGILDLQKVDLIVSDVKMPILNGIEFLHRIKRDKGEIPFIMMTGFSEVIEIKEAYEIGADGFLAKPYREADLMDQIHKIDDVGTVSQKEQIQFIGVSIEEFVAGANIQYPVYMEIDGKYVKVANKGENITNGQVQEFKQKGIDALFINKTDFINFIQFNLSIKLSILKSDRIDIIKKVKFFKIIHSHFTRYFYALGPDDEIMNLMKENLFEMMDFLKKPGVYFHIHEIFKEKEDHIENNVIAAMIGINILKGLSWCTEEKLVDFFFASCIQDVSLGLSGGEVHKDHPLESVQIIQDWNVIDSPSFFKAILQQHEKVDGSGYPSSLKGSQVCSVGNLLSLCGHMVGLMRNVNMTFEDAREWMVEREKSCYKQEFFESLMLFKREKVES